MYWRVRKVTPEQIARQYGIHAALFVSVLFNVILFTTRPAAPKVAPEIKVSYEQFARQVTQHLLDTSYISYADSTLALLRDELAPGVKKQLIAQEMLAKNEDDLRSTAKTLIEQHQVAAIKITECLPSDLDQNGMLPVEVRGIVAIHSAQESGPSDPVHFDFKFKIGGRAGPDGKPMLSSDGKTPVPCIVEFQDVSPKQG
ncbi:MAG TPA: hypothetical protein V6C81_00720 [Planktothrix sp.]|jgi:hypothetical protein